MYLRWFCTPESIWSPMQYSCWRGYYLACLYSVEPRLDVLSPTYPLWQVSCYVGAPVPVSLWYLYSGVVLDTVTYSYLFTDCIVLGWMQDSYFPGEAPVSPAILLFLRRALSLFSTFNWANLCMPSTANDVCEDEAIHLKTSRNILFTYLRVLCTELYVWACLCSSTIL